MRAAGKAYFTAYSWHTIWMQGYRRRFR
jgi:hypothetical protein